ncbi:hypothetical protein SteCoe_29218 [Stentor coeruleus]|uniref:Dynamin-type G domain-containing protein n=1 Tax=Stentor coeruleus TaxID=5963 RepID=A0A1R2B6F6_9CILI|nr:hypothetical protein SteCoe_29218 [Stentor coeruleus]
MEDLVKQLNILQNSLTQAEISKLIQLPEIIVVGEQSSGKSSVLQSIIEREILPKGQGIVTRCPIRIRMQKSKDEREFACFEHLGNTEFTIDDVSEIIKKRSEELTVIDYVTDVEITVDLFGPNMTNLTLVDLPGIVSIASEGQPKDIVQRIEKIVKDRISSNHVLILAITPTSNDSSNSKSVPMAKQADPEGIRTLGVFTKLDRIEKGCNPFEMMNKLSTYFKLGYVGVVCRDQSDIISGKTFQDQFIKEAKFFSDNEEFQQNFEIFGIAALRNKLENEFRKHLENTLPIIYKEVDTQINEIDEELTMIGSSIPQGYNLHAYAYSAFNEIFIQIQSMIDGSGISLNHNNFIGGSIFRKLIINFHSSMKSIKGSLDIQEDKFNHYIMNSGGLEGSCKIPNTLIKQLVSKNLDKLKKPIFNFLNKFIKSMMKFIQSFKNGMLEQYKKLKTLFIIKFEEIIEKLRAKIEKKIEFLINLEKKYIDPDMDFINFKLSDYVDQKLGKKRPQSAVVHDEDEDEYEDDDEEADYDDDYEDNNAKGNTSYDELEAQVIKYFYKSRCSLDENIPKYIKFYLLDHVIQQLRSDIFAYINECSDIASIFEETPNITRKRAILSRKKCYLQNAFKSLRLITSSYII